MSSTASIDTELLVADRLRRQDADAIVAAIEATPDDPTLVLYRDLEVEIAEREGRDPRDAILEAVAERLDDDPAHAYDTAHADDADVMAVKRALEAETAPDDPLTASELAVVAGIDETNASAPNTRKAIKQLVEAEVVPIVGTADGYYIARTAEQAMAGAEALRGRVQSTLDRADALERMAAGLPEGGDDSDD